MATSGSPRIIRGYELLERIGSGGFGEVYKAYQSQIKRDVAVKIIHPQYANNPDFIRRFEIEAELVARLEHPHIVPLYDYWREPNGAFLVMRLLRGGNLTDALDGGPWGLPRTEKLLSEISGALHIAHRSGIVHRDLKPANILLDEDGNAYLGDFGIAKDLNVASGDDSELVLTPNYAAPEQFQGENIQPQTDIYNLGLVVYEMLAGQAAFQGTMYEIMMHHMNDPLPSLREHRPDIPSAVDEVLRRATLKDIKLRYQTAPQMAEAFRRALVGGGPQASINSAEVDADTVITDATLSQELKNPYKGLRAFREADAVDFYGRERLTERLIDRLGDLESKERFLAVVGPSGSGKSSVVKAGLIPELRKGALRGSADWFVVDMFPSANPLAELEAALLRIAVNPPASLMEQLESDSSGLMRAVKRILPSADSTLLLVIDQFEELFTLVENEVMRTHFIDSLIAAIRDPRTNIRVIVTLRADFYDRPLLYEDLGELVRANTEVVLPLSSEELQEAITRPAQTVGVALEPGLVEVMVRDVGEQPGTLPLMQYALTELFEQRKGLTLTLDAYRSIGEVAGALARRAEQLYNSLDAEGQQATRQLFLRLVTLGDGTENTRRRVRRTDIATGERIDEIIELYGNYRLLTFDRDPATRGSTVEVAHEALIRTWQRLRGWIADSREDLEIQRRLAASVMDWEQARRDPSYLATGARLSQFQDWSRATGLIINDAERNYITISADEEAARTARDEATARRVQNLGRTAVVLGVMIALAIAATLVFLNQASEAQTRVAFAEETLSPIPSTLTPVALTLAAGNAQVAAAQGQVDQANQLAAGAQTQVVQSGQTLTPIPQTLTPVALTLQAGADQVMEAQNQVLSFGETLTPIPETLTPVALTLAAGNAQVAAAQGQVDQANQLAAGAQTQVVQSGQTLTPIPQTLTPVALTLQAGAQQVAMAQEQVLSFGETLTPIPETLTPVALTLAAGNAQVAAAQGQVDQANQLAADAQTQVVQSGQTLTPIPQTLTPVALTLQAGAAQVTDAQNQVLSFGETLTPIPETLTPVALTLAAGNAQVAAAQGQVDQANQLADAAQTQAAQSGQTLTPVALTLVASNEQLVAAEEQIAQSNELAAVAQAAVTDARAAVVQAGETLTPVQATLIAAEATAFRAASVPLAVNADQVLSNGNYDLGLALLLQSLDINPNLTQAQRLLNQMVYSGARFSFPDAQAAAISTDGNYVVANQAETLAAWDMGNLEAPAYRLSGHNAPVTTLAFSRNGLYLASADQSGEIILWDGSSWPQTATEIARLQGHSSRVNDLTFNLDGTRLLSAGQDNTSILWDIPGGTEINRYSLANDRPILRVEFAYGERQFFAWADAGSGKQAMEFWGIQPASLIWSEIDLIFDVFDHRPETFNRYAFSTRENELVVWEVGSNRQETRRFNTGFNWNDDRVAAKTFDPSGAQILVAISNPSNNRLLLLDVSSGSELMRFQGDGAQQVNGLAISPDGTLALSGSGNEIVLWNMSTGTEIRRLSAHNDLVQNLAFSTDGRYAFSTARDGDIRVWDIASGDPAEIRQITAQAEIPTIKYPGFSPDGASIYAGVWVSLIPWNAQTGQQQPRNDIGSEILNVVYHPKLPYALTVLENGAVMWDMSKPIEQSRIRFFGAENDTYTGIAAINAEGTQLLIEGRNLTLRDLTTNAQLQAFDKASVLQPGEVITSAAISPDNRFVVATTGQPDIEEAAAGTIVVWSTETGAEVLRFPVLHSRTITSVAISPDSRYVLTGSDDNTLILWDIETGDLLRRLYGHRADVNTVLFTPDGRSALSGSDDSVVILWDLESGQPTRRFVGHTHPVTGLALRPDGREFVSTTGVEGDTLRVWRIETPAEVLEWTRSNRYVRPLTAAERNQYGVRAAAAPATSQPADATSTPPLPTPIPADISVEESSDCAAFGVTQPVTEFGATETTFTWDKMAIPGIYWIVIYNEAGQSSIHPQGDVDSAIIKTDVATLGADQTFEWEVLAFYPDLQPACTSPRFSATRAP